ncbi:hypothetical protein SLA_6077 [Streptomyces laurentii]|uniref:Uncharacterized protein n=1 Tax=Streptomyces laurentii TaxID=39478 RepID=A0A160P6Y1_STRLU|nr:hypothetical protein SLA_6077 [Streptomyces laurentii]
MAHRITALLTVAGVVAGTLFLAASIDAFRAGGPALWLVAGGTVFLGTVLVRVRDIRRARPRVVDGN